MAMIRHPKTGVLINVLGVKRPRKLDDIEAETARVLRAEGHRIQDIAAMLGTNQGRVQEALGPGTAPDGDTEQPALL